MKTILLLNLSWKITFTHLHSFLQTVSLHGQRCYIFWFLGLRVMRQTEAESQKTKWNSGVPHL